MNTLYLIRHGQTQANKDKKYVGQTDVPLCGEGRLSLLRLKEAGIYPAACNLRFYTSGLLRADQTLQTLYGGVPFTPLAAFREMHFGRFEGGTYDDLKGDPDYLRWILDETGDVCAPGGESRNAATKRIRKGLEALIQTAGDALLVTHGGVIVRIMEALFPLVNRNFYEWQPQNGRGYFVTWEGTEPGFREL